MPYSCSQGSIPHPYLNPRHLNRTLFTLRRKQRRAGLLSGAIRRPLPSCQRSHAVRTPGEIITDIQRELARRGYYNGPVDGLYGQRTDGAIRDFERAAGLKLSAQPSEALLQAITQSPLTPGNGAGSTQASGAIRASASPPAQSAAALARVIVVQRVLSEFGYGQIKPTGTLDPDTQRAIAEFENQHKLPITGRFSEEFIRRLSAVSPPRRPPRLL
jgi:peptidoglycan hydrolase-like protein with peptidoglycan-binding domain